MVRGFPQIGDVVFTTEGATFGETWQIVDESIALAQRLILFKLDSAKLTNDYLFFYLISDFVKAEQKRYVVGPQPVRIVGSIQRTCRRCCRPFPMNRSESSRFV